MKKIVLVAVLVFFSINSYCQQISGSARSSSGARPLSSVQSKNVYEMTYDFYNSNATRRIKSGSKDVKGNPLVFKGKNNKLVIFTKEGRAYKIPNGNYDAKADKLVSEYVKDSVYLFEDKNIKYAMLNNRTIKKFSDKKGDSRFYFVLNTGDKITFIKSSHAKVKEGVINPLTQTKLNSDSYFIFNKYFYVNDNSKAEKISLTKKAILNLMNDKKEEIQNYVEQNKLSYKKESDVIKIFNYYNT